MKLAALLLAACASAQATPSVLVIVLDDVAVDDLAIYGGPVSTPYLSQLAAAGVTFTSAYANAYCAPSRRSLLFGSWAQGDNGGLCTATPSGNTPALSDTSIAEALPSHAAAMIGKWHMGSSPSGGPWEQAPMEHGFEFWGAGIPGNVGADAPCGAPLGSNYSNWLRVDADSAGYTTAVSTTYQPLALRDFFIAGWTATSGARLGMVNLQLPHAPFHAPPALLPAGFPTPVTQRQKYEAMIVAADKSIGQMLAHVSLSETLIVVVGDNGTPPTAGGGSKSKGTCYQRGVHVPLIVAGGPTVNGGRTSSDLVHLVDVFATCVEAGGGSVYGDGVSFLGVLDQATAYTPRSYVFLGNRWEDLANLPNDRAAASASWKLIQYDVNGDGSVDTEELYDLVNDPGETTNVVSASTEDDALRAWLESEAP